MEGKKIMVTLIIFNHITFAILPNGQAIISTKTVTMSFYVSVFLALEHCLHIVSERNSYLERSAYSGNILLKPKNVEDIFPMK